jgi:chromate reductase, NAD(P)H dehydrogenase (quinone)
MRILGLSGSLRRDSHNSSLLRAAAMSLPPGVELELYDGLADLPHYNADLDGEVELEPVARLRETIAAADGVLIATPEFNGSIPGPLKNALDWASRPFPDNALRGKPVAVVGASTVAHAHIAFADDGHLADPGTRGALGELVTLLATRAGAAELVAT